MRRRRSSEADGSEDNDMMESDHILESSPLRTSPNCRPTAGVRFHRRFYLLHSSLIFVIGMLGMIHNGGNQKYIPVKPAPTWDISFLQGCRECAVRGDAPMAKLGVPFHRHDIVTN